MNMSSRPVFRGGLRGLKPPPPELWFSWFLLDLCWCHEHHNGSYRPSWPKTCFRMQQNAPFRRRKCQNFSWGGHSPLPRPYPHRRLRRLHLCLRHSTPQTTFLHTGLMSSDKHYQRKQNYTYLGIDRKHDNVTSDRVSKERKWERYGVLGRSYGGMCVLDVSKDQALRQQIDQAKQVLSHF